MLLLEINKTEFFDEQSREFVTVPGRILKLEHSLVSLSLWESKWKKPFLGKAEKTIEETKDYIRCMVIGEDLDELPEGLTDEDVLKVNEYLQDSQTATTFNDLGKTEESREIHTAELLYYYMVTLQIPMECQYWNLNRLITLIRVCSIKNQPPKKQTRQEIASRHRMLNQQRRGKRKP